MSETLSYPSLYELEAALQPAVEALRAAKGDEAVAVALVAYEAAYSAYSDRWDADEERIWAPMRDRIEAAAAGQPPIVQEAMKTGVSILRYDLTPKEKGQLQRARRRGLLEWELNSMGFPPRVLYCSYAIAFGTTQGGVS